MATSADMMTSDQLREHLYHDLQSKGVLQTMKSQLRQRIAKELHKAAPIGAKMSQKSRSRSEPKKTTLDGHMASAMVADYLKKAGFEYSLSVFLPEAEVNIDKLCTMDDLIQYLRIPASSPLHSKLIPRKSDQSLLGQLLKAVAHSSIASPQEKSVPKSPSKSASPKKKEPKKSSVAEQLQALDQSYAQKAEEQRLRTQQNLEERLRVFQCDLEAQYKAQLETELSLYKSRELAKMRMEEEEKYQQQLASERVKATVAQQKKMEELRKTEQQMMDRYRKKEQDLESSIHTQRQTLLTELNSLKVREAELKRQAELNQRTCSLEEERLNKMARQLEGREKALEKTKSHYEDLVEEKAQKFKLELESQLQSKQNALIQWEAELKGNKDKMAFLQSQLTKLELELQAERVKADQLQALLHETMGKQITLQGQKDALQKRVDQVVDYEQTSQELTKELENAEKKLQEYKRRNTDNQRLIKELQSKVPCPTLELEALKKELDEIRTAHYKQVLTMESSNKELRRQLMAQTEYAGKLQKQLDDQMIQLLSAHREIRDIHTAMEQLRLGGGKAEARKTRNPGSKKVTLVSTPLATTLPSLTSHAYIFQPSHPHTSHGPLLSHPHTSQAPQPSQSHRSTAEPISLTGHHSHSPTSDMSSHLLAESRATIERLEKEAHELESTCQQLQQDTHRPPITLPTNDGGDGNPPSVSILHPKTYQEHELDTTVNAPLSYGPPGNGMPQSVPHLAQTSFWPPGVGLSQRLPNPASASAISTWPSGVSMSQRPSNPMAVSTVSYNYLPPSVGVSQRPPHPVPTSSVWTSSLTMATGMLTADGGLRVDSFTGVTVAHTSSVTAALSVTAPCQLSATPPLTRYPSQPTPPTLPPPHTASHKHTSSASVSEAPTVAEPTARTTAASPPTATLSSVMAPTQSRPLKISLDELWKSSDMRSSPIQTTTSVPLEETPTDQHKDTDSQAELPTTVTTEISQPTHQEEPPLSNPKLSSHTTSNEEEGVDPVMLKYMELVKQKRETAQSEPVEVSVADGEGDNMDLGIPSLSQASENYGGFSDKEDDPFEDW